MHYAILCYDSEEVVGSWTKEEDDAVMAARAKTLRKGGASPHAPITDGPFAETKEMLLGFFVVECATFDEAIDAARQLAQANCTKGAYEIRPMSMFQPSPAVD